MSFVEKINAFIGADKPKLADFYACFDQLYMLLKSGSTLQQAINEIAHVQTNAKLGQALRNISRNLSFPARRLPPLRWGMNGGA